MITTVVCPLTGDPNAERALPSAHDAARALATKLVLFSAVEDPHMVGRCEDYLEVAGQQGRGPGAEIPQHQVIIDPHAPRALAERSASADVVMVMATSAQPLMHIGYLGSAAERVVRESHHPRRLTWSPQRNTSRRYRSGCYCLRRFGPERRDRS